MRAESVAAAVAPSGTAPVDGNQAQLNRQRAEERRAREKQQNARASLRQHRQEGALAHGRYLLRVHSRPVVEELTRTLGLYLEHPTKAGPFLASLPRLEAFRKPEQAVVLALQVVVNQISAGWPFSTLAVAIGRALETEVKGQLMAASKPATFRQMRRRHSKRAALVRDRMLKALKVDHEPWTTSQKAEVGGLLLTLIERATELIEVRLERMGDKTVKMVRPTPATLELCRSIGASDPRVARGPMLQPPVPWRGAKGGGYLQSEEGLVRHRMGGEVGNAYFEARLQPQTLTVVNHLQGQQLWIDPEFVGIVRQAWEAGGCGLFKVQRNGPRLPEKPLDDASRQEWGAWKREAAIAHDDQRRNLGRRLQIERGIKGLEENAGQPVWFPYELDFRGRIYTSNKLASHQGPDYSKGAINFAQGQVLDEAGFHWLLRSAAGHWGLSRATWDERLQWGLSNLELLVALAENPLNLSDRLATASDPWQLLQAARAIRAWLQDRATPIGCPVRLDQTTSGCGIIAALLRDEWLATQTNVTGSRPLDLYATVADGVIQEVHKFLHHDQKHVHLMAQQLLEMGINRKLLKGPVLAVPYGGRMQGTIDGLCRYLEEKLGWVEAWEYDFKVTRPATFLAKVIHEQLKRQLPSAIAFQQWARAVGRAVISKQHLIEYTTPAGFPVRLGNRTPTKLVIKTELFGRGSLQMTLEEEPPSGELSVRQTNGSLAANLIHSLDGSLCQVAIDRAAAVGEQLLTNHDCFAVRAGSVPWLQSQLLDELRETFKTDWLGVMAKEIKNSTGISELPRPPKVGTLRVGTIGCNPYCFS